MSLLNDFKAFIMRGNVVDLAVGIIIGAAFGKIVTSFVNDILMPPIGLLLGGMDFSNLAIILRDQVGTTPPVAIRYGVFINTLIDFLIVAAAIFLLVKAIASFYRKEEAKKAEPPAPTREEELLKEIRDILKETA